MTPSIPLPTDNFYKFLCFLGLVLMAVSVFAYASVQSATVQELTTYWTTVVELDGKDEKSKVDTHRLEFAKDMAKATAENAQASRNILMVIFVVGGVLSMIGGYYWLEKIQPRDNEIANLQRDELRMEVVKLQAEVNGTARQLEPPPH